MPLTKEEAKFITDDQKWLDIKKTNGCETTEQLFSIEYPAELQCKKIDEIIKKITTIEKESVYEKYHDEDDLKGLLDSINYDARYLDYDIEEIRTAIEQVRRWGQEWKDLAKRIILENDIKIEDI